MKNHKKDWQRASHSLWGGCKIQRCSTQAWKARIPVLIHSSSLWEVHWYWLPEEHVIHSLVYLLVYLPYWLGFSCVLQSSASRDEAKLPVSLWSWGCWCSQLWPSNQKCWLPHKQEGRKDGLEKTSNDLGDSPPLANAAAESFLCMYSQWQKYPEPLPTGGSRSDASRLLNCHRNKVSAVWLPSELCQPVKLATARSVRSGAEGKVPWDLATVQRFKT